MLILFKQNSMSLHHNYSLILANELVLTDRCRQCKDNFFISAVHLLCFYACDLIPHHIIGAKGQRAPCHLLQTTQMFPPTHKHQESQT